MDIPRLTSGCQCDCIPFCRFQGIIHFLALFNVWRPPMFRGCVPLSSEPAILHLCLSGVTSSSCSLAFSSTLRTFVITSGPHKQYKMSPYFEGDQQPQRISNLNSSATLIFLFHVTTHSQVPRIRIWTTWETGILFCLQHPVCKLIDLLLILRDELRIGYWFTICVLGQMLGKSY